ncbi:putative late blight resistance protein-like protein R1B-16 [Forsythia ovata]|uniref:Late blight resistance protein-like protein R1B-16 n=1 Tax=Forsythia ovata TaxID=205694 RepID=A0ABD1WSH7_9LAMI
MDVIGIELLVHLRYLAVPCKQLPLIESLHKLEYLFVGNTEEVEIPEILFNMVSLRHVYFSGGAYFSASCRQQATEDESFQINNIQSISLLTISDKIDEKILRCSPNLHKLKGRVGSSLNHSFDFLNQLESLKLSVYDGEKEDSRSHLFSLPLTLKKLSLDNVHVSPEQIEIIGRLPNLEVLKLEDAVLEGEQWDASEAEFPQLIFLKLDNVLIAEWNASSDNFPRLERLVLQHCHHLKMIPSSLGDIPTLQMIEVYRCAQDIEESAMQIQEEQEENGNEELKVIIYD